MAHATSADGTRIHYERIGHGHPVIIVNGAFGTSRDAEPLARALEARGLEGVVVDRRGRGESTDELGDGPVDDAAWREVADLTAVIDAVGGEPALIGHSSGALLAFLTAAAGASVGHLFLSEPPMRFGVDEPRADLAGRIASLVAEGRPDEALAVFQTEGVGLPAAAVEQIRASPMFPGLVAVARSTAYDTVIARTTSTPSAELLGIRTPVTLPRGEETFPMLVAAFDRLARELPTAEAIVVPESRNHALDPEATARVIADRMLAIDAADRA